MSDATTSDEYREGWKAGYAKGQTDGEAQGYSDARYRSHLAVDAMKTALPPTVIRQIEDAITNIVGKRN